MGKDVVRSRSVGVVTVVVSVVYFVLSIVWAATNVDMSLIAKITDVFFCLFLSAMNITLSIPLLAQRILFGIDDERLKVSGVLSWLLISMVTTINVCFAIVVIDSYLR